MRRARAAAESLAPAASALLLLGVARLLPAHGFGLWLRLVAATFVLLVPGRLAARALRVRGESAAVAWALAALTLALVLTFAVHASLWLALVVLVVVAVLALPLAARAPAEGRELGSALALAAGLAFGVALWHVAGIVHADALFHLGRVRKLDAYGSLSLRAVDEFRDGGLHPGYAFPLWHGFLALVARLGGVDPRLVVLHAPSALAPVAFAVTYEAGRVLFRSTWLGAAVVAAAVARAALAPGHGGAFAALDNPANLDRYVLVPAALALLFAHLRAPSWQLGVSIAAAGGAIALVHPTTAVFLALPVAGFLVARVVLARGEVVAAASALAALLVPVGVVFAWLAPLAKETASHDPSPAELRRALAQYGSQLDVDSLHRYALRPEVVSRSGAVAVAGLLLVPLAVVAARRRWAAFVLGGTVAVLAVELLKALFPRFADAISLSQARRAAGFAPIPFALAGGAAVLARPLRVLLLPAALVAGILLQRSYPGDFGLGLRGGGPAWATWIALAGGAAALVAAALVRLDWERPGLVAGAAAILFALPVAVEGFRDWSPLQSSDRYALTPGLARALRDHVPERAVVLSDAETSYRIVAAAPVYVADGPPAHVADTKANRPQARLRDALEFMRTGDLAIARRYRAGWIVIDRSRYHPRLRLPVAYRDSRYTLYRLPS